jgi:hypothetical protein
MQRRYDPYWKGILERVFDDFLRFVFPDADKELNLDAGFEFLDKELGEMYPEPEKNGQTRYVDKLAKVYRHDGRERWILAHIEVQGYHDRGFPQRMFRYYYKLLDRFASPVTSIAIFSGIDSDRMPNQFEDECLGTHLTYKYNTVSIAAYTDEELEQSDNPFAFVLLVAKKALLKGKGMDSVLLEEKLRLARLLLEKGLFTKPKIRALFTFLNNYIRFEKSATYRIFEDQLNHITKKEKTMDIFEQVAEVRFEEGLKKGEKRGEKKATQKASRLFVEYLLRETKHSLPKIASLANVSQPFVKKVKKELAAK